MPSTGQNLVTIGNDLCMRIWTEDPAFAPNSGRRFRKVSEIQSHSRVAFVSLDVKNVGDIFNYIAVIDRQGLLTVYSPSMPDDFREWHPIDQFHVHGPVPGRGDETSFRVRFDKNISPLPYITDLIDDRDMLSLVVTSLRDVVIYSTVPNVDRESGASSPKFYEVFRLPVHPTLVRDVQWCPFNVRGVDWIATACKDGSLRIFELTTVRNETGHAVASITYKSSWASRQQPQSSLTTAIVGRTSTATETTPDSQPSKAVVDRALRDFSYAYEIKHMTVLESAHDDAWALDWDPSGQCLLSSGSDGVIKTWRKSIVHGDWLLFADQTVDAGQEEQQGQGSE